MIGNIGRQWVKEAHLEPSQTFMTANGLKLITTFAKKNFIIDICISSKYAIVLHSGHAN